MENIKKAHRYYDRKVNYYIDKFINDILDNKISNDILDGICDEDFKVYLNSIGIDTTREIQEFKYRSNYDIYSNTYITIRELISTENKYRDYQIEFKFEDSNSNIKVKDRKTFFLELVSKFNSLKSNSSNDFNSESISWLLCLKPLTKEEIRSHIGGAKICTNIEDALDYVYGPESFYYINGYKWLEDGTVKIYNQYFRA